MSRMIQQNFKKNPHTARFLATFHSAGNVDRPAEILADGTPVDSDGNVWVAPEERAAAMDFLNSDAPADEYVAPERPKAAPAHKRGPAGYLVEFAGHQVRCGDAFITEAQAKWIVDILVKREVPGAAQTFIRLEQGLAKRAGSDFITANKNAPLKPVAPVAIKQDYPGQPSFQNNSPAAGDEVPAGRYALRVDGVVKFYKLDRPTEGKWAGYVFLKVQASDDLYLVRSRMERDRIIAEIAQDVLGAERLYGMELGKCSRCGRTLTDETSRAYGIGPECRKK